MLLRNTTARFQKAYQLQLIGSKQLEILSENLKSVGLFGLEFEEVYNFKHRILFFLRMDSKGKIFVKEFHFSQRNKTLFVFV